MIAIGALFHVPVQGTPNRVAERFLDGLDGLTLLFAAYFIYRAKGARWFVAALVVAELWILFFASYIAGMAVAGDWNSGL